MRSPNHDDADDKTMTVGTTSRTSPRSNHSDPLVSIGSQDEENKNHSSIQFSMVTITTLASSVCHGIQQSCSHWTILALGQLLSFLLACSGAAQATLHLNCNLSAPTFASGLIYFVLSFFLIPVLYAAKRKRSFGAIIENDSQDTNESPEEENKQEDEVAEEDDAAFHQPRHLFLRKIPLHTPAWSYFCIAFLDVEANYLTVLAFRFTTLTSITLFDALAIPSAMILSKIFLKRTYQRVHLIGAIVCMTGIVANVLTDYESDKDAAAQDDDVVKLEKEEYPHRILGDALAIMGGLVYGANNVLQEFVVKSDGGPMEFLAMLGIFGTCISAVQVLILERQDVAEFFSKSMSNDEESTCGIATGILLLMAYVLSLVFSYVGGSYFLLISEAALFNLSLLTGDLWSVTFSIVAERIVPSPLFFVALVLIVSGVLLYETGPSPIHNVVAENEEENVDTSFVASEREPSGDEANGRKNPWRYDEVEMTPELT